MSERYLYDVVGLVDDDDAVGHIHTQRSPRGLEEGQKEGRKEGRQEGRKGNLE